MTNSGYCSLTPFIEKITYSSLACIERRKRIRLSIAAYAYEVKSRSIMSDRDWDALALSIDTSIRTGNRVLDGFFRTKFSPYTGMWIHEHPDLLTIERLYEAYFVGNVHGTRRKTVTRSTKISGGDTLF